MLHRFSGRAVFVSMDWRTRLRAPIADATILEIFSTCRAHV